MEEKFRNKSDSDLAIELGFAKMEILRLREQRDRYREWSDFWRSIAEIMWRFCNETQNKT